MKQNIKDIKNERTKIIIVPIFLGRHCLIDGWVLSDGYMVVKRPDRKLLNS